MAKCIECKGCVAIVNRFAIEDNVYTRFWCDFCRVHWIYNVKTGEWKKEEQWQRESGPKTNAVSAESS